MSPITSKPSTTKTLRACHSPAPPHSPAFSDTSRLTALGVRCQVAPLDEPVVKLVVRHPEVLGIDLYRAASALGIEGVELTHSGAPYIELVAKGVSKASALADLCAERGIDAAEVAAIGDAVNDAPMLAWAGTPLCPANALPEVRALADRVLPCNDEDGVAVYLEELVDAARGVV